MKIRLLINSSSWTNNNSFYDFDLSAGDTPVQNYSQIKKNTRIYYDNNSLIASNQLTDIAIYDPYQKFYNELGLQSRNNFLQVIDDDNKIIFNGIYLSSKYDISKKITSIKVDEAIKILDNVNILPTSADPNIIIQNITTQILGYNLLELGSGETLILNVSSIPPITSKISFRNYITSILQWCRFENGNDQNYNQKIVLWSYADQRFIIRKLLMSSVTPIDIDENDLVDNSLSIDDGIGFVYNDLSYKYRGSADNLTFPNNQSIKLYRSRPLSFDFNFLTSGSVVSDAIQTYANFLTKKRNRISFSLNYDILKYNLSGNLQLGNKIGVDITNQFVDFYGYYYIEGFSIDPISNTVDLDLVEAFDYDNF